MAFKSLAEWARKYKRHPNTLTRWRLNGVRGVRLHCWRLGGRWVANDDDVAAFIAALSHRVGEEQLLPATVQPMRQTQLGTELDRAGW